MPVRKRIIDIQEAKITRDRFGSEVATWATFSEEWAHVNQTGISEKFENDSNLTVAKRTARFTIVWRQGVNKLMRIIYDGLVWDIEGIAEIGRRRELEITAQTNVNQPAPTP